MHLLDPSRVDPPVLHQLRQGDPGGLAADRVEAGQQHRLRGVVDHHVHPGHLLERPDVAALPADDPTLHIVTGQVHGGDYRLRRLVGRQALDRAHNDELRAGIRLTGRLAFDVPRDENGLALGLVLDRGNELRLGLLGSQPRDPLQGKLMLSLSLD